MKKTTEIENMLREDATLAPSPQLKDKILERVAREAPAASTHVTKRARKIPYFKPLIAAAAVFLILITSVLGGIGIYNEDYSSVYVDINPSVEIVLNRFEKINDVIYHNEDAVRVFSELDLKGKKINDGLCMIIDKLSNENYIKDDAEMFITATSKNNKNLTTFLDEITSAAKSYSDEKGYSVSFSSQTMTKDEIKEAHENGMSPAKYKLIELIKTFYPDFDEEALNEMDMKTLQEIRKVIEGIGGQGSNNDKNQTGDKPIDDEPGNDKPVNDKPVDDKSDDDKPVNDKPINDKLGDESDSKEESPEHNGKGEHAPNLNDNHTDDITENMVVRNSHDHVFSTQTKPSFRLYMYQNPKEREASHYEKNYPPYKHYFNTLYACHEHRRVRQGRFRR